MHEKNLAITNPALFFLFYLFLDQPLFCVPHIYFKVLILIELPAPTTILSRRRRSR